MMSEEEVSAQCPYCYSPITFVCEIFSGGQTYVEDCEVCCKPIEISYNVSENNEIENLCVKRLS